MATTVSLLLFLHFFPFQPLISSSSEVSKFSPSISILVDDLLPLRLSFSLGNSLQKFSSLIPLQPPVSCHSGFSPCEGTTASVRFILLGIHLFPSFPRPALRSEPASLELTCPQLPLNSRDPNRQHLNECRRHSTCQLRTGFTYNHIFSPRC